MKLHFNLLALVIRHPCVNYKCNKFVMSLVNNCTAENAIFDFSRLIVAVKARNLPTEKGTIRYFSWLGFGLAWN